MSIEELMNQSVPFASVLIKVSRIPIVQIELSVSETRKVSIDVTSELKDDKKANEVDHAYGDIGAWEKIVD